MHRVPHTWLFLAALTLLTAVRLPAAPYVEDEKRYSWYSLNRVERDTPAAQLSYCDELSANGSTRKAIRQYQALSLKWPGAPETSLALLRRARLLDQRGSLVDAYDAYQALMEKYSGTFPYDEVMESQFRISKQIMQRRKWPLFFGGFASPEQAAPLFEKIVRNGPRWPKSPEAQYLAGQAYELSDQYELAVAAYLLTQQRYPDSPFAEKSAYGRLNCWVRIAEESRNDEEALEQAWAATVIYLNSWPNAENAAAAKALREDLLRQRAKRSYDKAFFYDTIAHRPASALVTYRLFLRKFPNTEWTDIAQARVQELAATVEQKTP